MSLITSIARAIGGGTTEHAGIPDEPGAEASISETATMENDPMSNLSAAPGAGVIAGILEADHKAAVAKAEADGKAAGRKEASDRMAAILGADGIKGDGGRMAAALDLSAKSPDMAAEGVVSFVTTNVPAAKADATATYEQERLASAGLTQPGGGGGNRQAKADLNPTSIYAARSAAVKGA
jgi:capsid assembly protease